MQVLIIDLKYNNTYNQNQTNEFQIWYRNITYFTNNTTNKTINITIFKNNADLKNKTYQIDTLIVNNYTLKI